MTTPTNSWGPSGLQNSTQIARNTNSGPPIPQISPRSAPTLPPRPANSQISAFSNGYNGYNSYSPYSGYGGYGGFGSGYGYNSSYGSYGSSYGMPYRSSMFNSYGSMGGYGSMYGLGSGIGYPGYDDAERRFVQYAEESSRNTFASVENIVRAFNSIAMMLDNTFFAMTSSFRAVLSVADNFGRLRTMFGQIWYTVNIFRFFSWAYRKLRMMMGLKVAKSASSAAWKEAAQGVDPTRAPGGGSSWPTLAFLGMLVSAPYIISKFIPKYEDKCNPDNWKTPGIRAKAVFDFIGSNPNELTIHVNDVITLAPMNIQEEMKLKNSGWAFAVFNGKSGVVPLNYLVISKSTPISNTLNSNVVPVSSNDYTNNNNVVKTHTKRVSFGENQIFENVDLDDYRLDDNTTNNSSPKECTELKTETPETEKPVDVKSS